MTRVGWTFLFVEIILLEWAGQTHVRIVAGRFPIVQRRVARSAARFSSRSVAFLVAPGGMISSACFRVFRFAMCCVSVSREVASLYG